MTAILKSHEIIYVKKNVVSIKGACSLIPLAFYLAVTAVTSISIMASNEELVKALANLIKSVMPIQDNIVMLKQYGPTQIGTDPLTSVGPQRSCQR